MALERDALRFRRIVVAVVAILFATGSFEEDEVLCEEAIAHITTCCPALAVDNVCGDPDGCNPATTLRTSESECLLELECGDEAREACARIQAVQDALNGSSDEEPRERVCP